MTENVNVSKLGQPHEYLATKKKNLLFNPSPPPPHHLRVIKLNID